MRKKIKKVLLLVTIFSTYLLGFNKAQAMGKPNVYELYQVKSKDEILVEDNKILDFYKNNSEILIFSEETNEIEELNLDLGNDIVAFSMQFIGNPYVSGGTSLTLGADCSGFVQTIFSNYGIILPRTTYEQSISGVEVLIEEISVGDIVSYGYNGISTHSAIYIGDGKIIHASTPELGIRIDSINIMPIITIRRVI